MKIKFLPILIFIVACVSACKEPQPVKTTQIILKETPAVSITDDQVEQAEKKLPLLHEGMTPREVLDALGLPADYVLNHGGPGGGPGNFSWQYFELNARHHLILDSDYYKLKYTSVVVNGVNIDKAAWRAEAYKNIQQ